MNNKEDGILIDNEKEILFPNFDKKRLKTIWLLMLIGSFIPILGLLLFIVGGLMANIYNSKSKSQLVKDNYTYAKRTFWFVIVMIPTSLVIMNITEGGGLLIFLFTSIWFLCRVIRGWRFILSEKPIYDQA